MIPIIYLPFITLGAIGIVCEFARVAKKRRKGLPPPQAICMRDYRREYRGK